MDIMPTPFWIVDPGHGWLAVDVKTYPDVMQYGTGFGYVSPDGGTAYLEEDCEAGAFLQAHPELQVRLPYTTFDTSWPGRNFERMPKNYDPFPSVR